VDKETSELDDQLKIEANDHQFGQRVDLREKNQSIFNINFENLGCSLKKIRSRKALIWIS
jgi:hypothetical protein